MKLSGVKLVLIAGLIYVLALFTLLLNTRASSDLRDRRTSEFSDYARLFQTVKALPARPAAPAEPLLVRLQSAVARPELKDRAPKLSSGAAAPGLPPSVSLSMEGVPFEIITDILHALSSDPNLSVTAFRIERSGRSDVRFDFSATLSEMPGSR